MKIGTVCNKCGGNMEKWFSAFANGWLIDCENKCFGSQEYEVSKAIDLQRENAILRRMVDIAAEYAYCPPVATTKAETMKAFMDQWREQAEKEGQQC